MAVNAIVEIGQGFQPWPTELGALPGKGLEFAQDRHMRRGVGELGGFKGFGARRNPRRGGNLLPWRSGFAGGIYSGPHHHQAGGEHFQPRVRRLQAELGDVVAERVDPLPDV